MPQINDDGPVPYVRSIEDKTETMTSSKITRPKALEKFRAVWMRLPERSLGDETMTTIIKTTTTTEMD